MNRNLYRENIGDAEISSQVASWARDWAETFRREAWQQSTSETAEQLTSEPQTKNKLKLPPLTP